MKNVIVTGASGFVGHSIVKYMASKGIKVYAFFRNIKNIDIFANNPNITILKCPMSEYLSFNYSAIKEPIDVFYHFAWDGTSGDKRGDYKIQLDNVKYTCDAIKMAKKLNVKKFIFAGSIIEFEYLKGIQNNKIDNRISNMYGMAKLMSRKMAHILAENVGIEFIETTISNIYGPGELSPRLLNSTLRKMLNGQKISLTTCEQLYDFIYINDAVKAYYLIGENGIKNRNYYIGNKQPRKLKEFIYEMRNCIDENLVLAFGEIPFLGESLKYNEFDTNILYNELKFRNSIEFKQGVINTISWLKEVENYNA